MQKDWDIGIEVVSIVGDADTVIAERVEQFRNKTNAVEPFNLSVVGVLRIFAVPSIYNLFTEGFDTTDLKDAKALLEELGG